MINIWPWFATNSLIGTTSSTLNTWCSSRHDSSRLIPVVRCWPMTFSNAERPAHRTVDSERRRSMFTSRRISIGNCVFIEKDSDFYAPNLDSNNTRWNWNNIERTASMSAKHERSKKRCGLWDTRQVLIMVTPGLSKRIFCRISFGLLKNVRICPSEGKSNRIVWARNERMCRLSAILERPSMHWVWLLKHRMVLFLWKNSVGKPIGFDHIRFPPRSPIPTRIRVPIVGCLEPVYFLHRHGKAFPCKSLHLLWPRRRHRPLQSRIIPPNNLRPDERITGRWPSMFRRRSNSIRNWTRAQAMSNRNDRWRCRRAFFSMSTKRVTFAVVNRRQSRGEECFRSFLFLVVILEESAPATPTNPTATVSFSDCLETGGSSVLGHVPIRRCSSISKELTGTTITAHRDSGIASGATGSFSDVDYPRSPSYGAYTSHGQSQSAAAQSATDSLPLERFRPRSKSAHQSNALRRSKQLQKVPEVIQALRAPTAGHGGASEPSATDELYRSRLLRCNFLLKPDAVGYDYARRVQKLSHATYSYLMNSTSNDYQADDRSIPGKTDELTSPFHRYTSKLSKKIYASYDLCDEEVEKYPTDDG